MILKEDSMRTEMVVGLIFIAAVSAWAADKIQPLNVKLGLWEFTSNTKMSGQLPPPPEGTTPEMQARMKEAMKGMMNRTTTVKTCLTKEKRDKGDLSDENPSCTRTIVTSTGTKLVVRTTCSAQGGKTPAGMKTEATVQADVLDSEHMKGSMHMTNTDGGRTTEMTSTISWKWLGSACGDVK